MSLENSALVVPSAEQVEHIWVEIAADCILEVVFGVVIVVESLNQRHTEHSGRRIAVHLAGCESDWQVNCGWS